MFVGAARNNLKCNQNKHVYNN